MPASLAEGKTVNKTVVRAIRGDITLLEVDAFVHYARPDLQLGSGYGNILAVRGGPTIQKELQAHGSCATGEAVVTGGGTLKTGKIIHAVGPRFLETDMEGKLRATMRAALRRAEELKIGKLAFPPMGAGFYGVPLDLCIRVMLEEIKTHLAGETVLREVILCAVDSRETKPFQAGIEKLS